MRPIAADRDIEIVLQNVSARLPLCLHFDIGSGLARSESFDAGVKRENVIVDIGAQIDKAGTSGDEGTTKTRAIASATVGHQIRHRGIGEVISADYRPYCQD